MTPTFPPPVPSVEDRAYWENCLAHRLTFQQCEGCNEFQHPPAPACVRCGTSALGWIESAGRGSVFTYTVVHGAPVGDPSAPFTYVVALVTLDDVPGIRLLTSVHGVPHRELRIGMRVDLRWQARGDYAIPVFAPHGE